MIRGFSKVAFLVFALSSGPALAAAPLLYRTAWPPTIAGFSIEYAPFAVLLAMENLKFFNQKEAAHGRAVA